MQDNDTECFVQVEHYSMGPLPPGILTMDVYAMQY